MLNNDCFFTNVSDAYSYHIGSATAVSFSTGDTSTPQGFIMFNQVIKTDATVAAWEFNAKTAGDVRFQVRYMHFLCKRDIWCSVLSNNSISC